MGWVKLDDGFPAHPKVVGLSDAAVRAHLEALCYAAKYETDGMVPDVVAANGPVRAELMASGLWENGPASAIIIHDYLVYNPSRSEREQNRNRTRTKRASREGAGRGLVSSSGGSGGDFAAFWAAYPRKVGKPKARTAFASALNRAPGETVVAGARRYRDDPNRADEFTAHPTTWLNRDGWDDDPLPPRSEKRGLGGVFG